MCQFSPFCPRSFPIAFGLLRVVSLEHMNHGRGFPGLLDVGKCRSRPVAQSLGLTISWAGPQPAAIADSPREVLALTVSVFVIDMPATYRR
jgi:hypothetical protein